MCSNLVSICMFCCFNDWRRHFLHHLLDFTLFFFVSYRFLNFWLMWWIVKVYSVIVVHRITSVFFSPRIMLYTFDILFHHHLLWELVFWLFSTSLTTFRNYVSWVLKLVELFQFYSNARSLAVLFCIMLFILFCVLCATSCYSRFFISITFCVECPHRLT